MTDDLEPGDVVQYPDDAPGGRFQEELAQALRREQASPTPAAAEHAFRIDQELRAKVKRMRGMWIEIAIDVHRFHKGELWRDLGYDNFEAWLADPGLEIERRWTYNVIAIVEQLVVKAGVEPSRLQQIEISKVSEILPAVRRGQVSVEQALGDAETLKRSDLELKYRGAVSNGRAAGPDVDTTVRTEREPVWKVCGHCGSRYLAQPE